MVCTSFKSQILALCFTVLAAGQKIEIKAPGHLPQGASQPVDHAFGSFSWPVHFFADYAGTPHTTTHNLPTDNSFQETKVIQIASRKT